MASNANKKRSEGSSFADITASANVTSEQNSTSPKSIDSSNSSRRMFKTDTDISKNRPRTDRVLEKWNPENTISTDVDLNKEVGQKGGKTVWDQFAENERLFGVKTDFDEAHYTTPVGREKLHPEEFKRREFEADRLANEILTKSGTPITVHMAEERGLLLPDDMDEEERYGSVARRISVVSTEDHNMPPRKSSIASLGEKAQQTAPLSPNSRRKSIVEQVSEDMNSAMKAMLEDRQRRRVALNPEAPEFSLNVNAPDYTPKEDFQYEQQYNNAYYPQYQMAEYLDPQMMNAYYSYDPYAMNAYYGTSYQQPTTASTGGIGGSSASHQSDGIYNPNAYYRPYRQQYVRNDGSHRGSHQNASGSHDNINNDLGPEINSPQ